MEIFDNLLSDFTRKNQPFRNNAEGRAGGALNNLD